MSYFLKKKKKSSSTFHLKSNRKDNLNSLSSQPFKALSRVQSAQIAPKDSRVCVCVQEEAGSERCLTIRIISTRERWTELPLLKIKYSHWKIKKENSKEV